MTLITDPDFNFYLFHIALKSLSIENDRETDKEKQKTFEHVPQ